MRSRSTSKTLALVITCALGLVACDGIPLDELPDGVTAIISIDSGEDFTFASWRLENDLCLQLPEDSVLTLNGTPPNGGDLTLGGRGGNPLAAYIDVGCELPSAFWNFTSELSAPYVFELSSGDVSLVMELSDPREITRCDFPACVSDSIPDEIERERP